MVNRKVRVWGRCFFVFDVVKRHLLDVHTYADDNQLYISFKPRSSASELETVPALQDCILDIKTWMAADKLKLNDDTTELIVVGTRAQLDKISISELSIDHSKCLQYATFGT